ncbi:unnamed protein product [Clavelina lepadiformis]|uniref:S phase cyclin A-associated protein in the endoplasmic reticulum N-terminal domain-containing protein n=1 Tax=Clavelina lepadiformis TaxID=159417 RepID=A0ABP0FDI4_CLALP
MNRSRDESTSSTLSAASSNGGKPKRIKNNSYVKRPKADTVETVKMIMEQEGRSARNLVSWSIPLDTYATYKTKSNKPKPTRSQGKRARSCGPVLRQNNSAHKENRSNSGERSINKPLGRQSGARKPVNIRARYWAYLFENLRRAVDEIYATCEGDSSVVECKEVLLMLDNYHHDFQALIDWINLQERLENTDAHDRPTSLAWEVRKSSPGRPRQKMVQRAMVPIGSSMNVQSCKVNRCLNFSKPLNVASLVRSAAVYVSQAGQSAEPVVGNEGTSKIDQPQQGLGITWADKVKGVKTAPAKASKTPPVHSPSKKVDAVAKATTSVTEVKGLNTSPDDGGEWETVTSRNRQQKHAKTQKSTSEPKLSAHTLKTETVSSYSETIIPSYQMQQTSQAAVPASPSTGSMSILMADRIIGAGGMTSPKTNNVSEGPSKVISPIPVEFSQNCFHSGCKKTAANEKDKKIIIEFQGHASNNDLSDLDTAEAEFFKEVQRDNEDSAPCNKNNERKEEFDQLDVLEQEVASLARTLHAEHDASIAVAEQQERDLRRQIQEVEDAKESPELDTDCESARSSAGAREIHAIDISSKGPLEWSDFVARFEVKQGDGLSWGDLVEEEELREPGRAVQMHEKLSSPSRKRTPAESKRKLEEKHRKAEARRLQMHQEKTHKIHELTEKVQEVVSWKNDLIDRQKNLLQSYHDEKLARAEEQRAMQLLNIKRKAQAEDTKVSEIAFINELQEQNKRHEVLMRIGEHESRIQDLIHERTKMQEVKSFKEESVKERRRALEKERQDRIEELKVKRKEQDARIEQQKIEKEKEREKLAKERARDRELRLSALNAAQQEAVTELQKKIQMKHDESERRHQEQLEQRKEKALELSLGRFSSSSLSSSINLPPNAFTPTSTAPTPSDSTRLSNGPINGLPDLKQELAVGDVTNNEKICDENCNIIGPIEGKGDGTQSHSSGSMTSPRSNTCHSDELSKEEQMRMLERQKTMKKRLKKLRTRMSTRGKEFLKRLENKSEMNTPSNKSKIIRLIKDVKRLLINQKDSSGPWPTNRIAVLDRALGEMNRILEKQVASDQISFRVGGGFSMLEEIFEILLKDDCRNKNDASILPDKSLSNAATTFCVACTGCHDNCVYVLYSNKATAVLDILLMQISKNESKVVNKGQIPTRSSLDRKNDAVYNYDVASPVLLRAMAVLLCELRNEVKKEKAFDLSSKSKSIMSMLSKVTNDERKLLEGYLNRGLDVVSYTVASGVLDVLSRYLSGIKHEVAPGTNLAAFVQYGLAFLEATTLFVSVKNQLLPDSISGNPSGAGKNKSASPRERSSSRGQWDNDPTQLLPTLEHTELMGIVSVLYGLLLHGAPERPTTVRSTSRDEIVLQSNLSEPKQIPEHTLNVALAVMSVLNAVAMMDLPLLQAGLGAEGVSLEFRHICTYLLWYCVQGDYTQLLHAVILCIGNFTLENKHNQDLVDSGAQPTVLQQLCLLPFAYFSSPALMDILFPTLISCCYDNDANLAMFEQEASRSLLTSFIETFLKENNSGNEDSTTKNNKDGIDNEFPRLLTANSALTKELLEKALRYFNDDRPREKVNVTSPNSS